MPLNQILTAWTGNIKINLEIARRDWTDTLHGRRGAIIRINPNSILLEREALEFNRKRRTRGKKYLVTKRAFLSNGQFIVSPIPKVGVLTDGEQSDLAGTVQIYASDALSIAACINTLHFPKKLAREPQPVVRLSCRVLARDADPLYNRQLPRRARVQSCNKQTSRKKRLACGLSLGRSFVSCCFLYERSLRS